MKHKPEKIPFIAWVLIFLLCLLSVGALASGGVLMLAPDGSLMQMPLSVMAGSPFSSFFIPGFLLFTFMGVYPLIIAYGLWKLPGWRGLNLFNPFKKMHWSWVGSLAAGVILIIWLSVELIWVPLVFLHILYFGWAGVIILLTLLPAVRRHCER